MLSILLCGSKTLCLGSRGFFSAAVSLPVRRPRRFWDFHVPEGAWNYRPRHNKPWTCNWRRWPYSAAAFELQPLETTLAARYALSDAPLTPVMFDFCSTVFACASTGKYYLCYGWPWPSAPRTPPKLPPRVYAFEGVRQVIAPCSGPQSQNGQRQHTRSFGGS
ncbi:hypothetical protein C8F04DRAFT_1122331 [Mycena alexandri]|uniref:Uncharacterized protein n=1 Tax=Mycena alexandri TaxID=1745969 RepID=A0AAD6SHE4_9AGAR|nr:hypothetical protein C8F04DRAFT_1122331 [Mycena alexandri]